MFKEQHYQVIKNLISPDVAELGYRYLLNKRRVFTFLHQNKLINPFSTHWGWMDDPTVKDTWATYGDVFFDTILAEKKEAIEKAIDFKLVETYTYGRLYKHGDILKRHKDRPSCQISATMFLGGEPWSIYVDNTGGTNNPGIKVDLEPGDCLMYRGCELEHWRDQFKGEICGQVFFHYNDANDPMSEKNKFDDRPILGLPQCTSSWIRNEN